MANEKSKAEIYRDERKARIAEAAKKNAKNMEKQNTAKKAVKKIVSIVLVAAIALGAVGLAFNYYGAWERMINIGGVGEDQKVSMAEYEYYYMQIYSNLLNTVSQYSSMGYDYGYDTSLPPSEQTGTTKDAEGNEISWEDAIRQQVISQIQTVKAYYNEAVKAGKDELTVADKAAIDAQIEEYREAAKSTETSDGSTKPKYSLNAYLRANYGGFMNERFFRNIIEESTIAGKYYEDKIAELAAGMDQAEVDKTYNKDTSAYDVVDFRYYKFTKTTLAANDGESDEALKKRQAEADATTKKNADDFLAAVTDETSFMAKAKELNKETADYDADAQTRATAMLKETITSNFTEEIAKWAFDGATKAGTKKIFTSADENTYYVILVTNTPHQVETVDVRHILFATQNLETGAALSEEEIAQKKKDAEAVLKEWQEGDKTEESFAALAVEHSEDTGSASNGGLTGDTLPGIMVKEYDAWIFDESRVAGDVEIVETEYGYHIIYFVKNNGTYYDSTIRDEMASVQFEDEAVALLESDAYEVGFGPRRRDYAEDKIIKKIMNLLAQSASSSTTATY